MKYHNITKADMLNGEGLRVVLWTSGCSHKCPGCHNAITWDKDNGLLFDEKAKKEIFDELENDWCSGLTLSGGDTLFPDSRETIAQLVKEVKEKLQAIYANQVQLNLFEEDTKVAFQVVKKLPYKFSYIFTTEDGKQRTMMIEDWELGMLYWHCLEASGGDEKVACEKVREKYLNIMTQGKDFYFFRRKNVWNVSIWLENYRYNLWHINGTTYVCICKEIVWKDIIRNYNLYIINL